MIALTVFDEDIRDRLKDAAQEFHITDGGLAITKAWVFEEPDLYREEILIEKDTLEWLVRFFNNLTDSNLGTTSMRKSTAHLLEALTGESLDEGVEVQELLEMRLGIHFTTSILSFELDRLSTLSSEKQDLLQDNIRTAAGTLADFLDRNIKRFNKEPRIWMPVEYLP